MRQPATTHLATTGVWWREVQAVSATVQLSQLAGGMVVLGPGIGGGDGAARCMAGFRSMDGARILFDPI